MTTTTTSTLPAHPGKLLAIHSRSQHSAGFGAHRFRSGPDTYVAVTIAPQGVQVPRILRRDVLRSRGIEIVYCGEGYSRNCGSRSMLGQAYARAAEIVARG
jgi:hypothetical protein